MRVVGASRGKLTRDMAQTIKYWSASMQGAIALRSEQRSTRHVLPTKSWAASDLAKHASRNCAI